MVVPALNASGGQSVWTVGCCPPTGRVDGCPSDT